MPSYQSVSCCFIAGDRASFGDDAYIEAGAVVLKGDQFFQEADIITKIRPPNDDEIPKLAGKTLIGMISPAINPELYETLTNQKTNVFALDNVPRMLSRAQTYDVLSSQANIAGYRAVIEAAEAFPRFFAGQMTAAGKVPPAKVLVVSAVTTRVYTLLVSTLVRMDLSFRFYCSSELVWLVWPRSKLRKIWCHCAWF